MAIATHEALCTDAVKSRIHLDLPIPDLQLLLDHGTALLRRPVAVTSWHVLVDPDGNELSASTAA